MPKKHEELRAVNKFNPIFRQKKFFYLPKSASDLSLPAGEINLLENLLLVVLGSAKLVFFFVDVLAAPTVDGVTQSTASVLGVIVNFFVNHRATYLCCHV